MKLALLPLFALTAACTFAKSDKFPVPEGAERFRCYANGTCDDGLVCRSDRGISRARQVRVRARPRSLEKAQATVRARARASDVCQPGQVNPEDSLHERWVRLCPGEFVMGSPDREPGREPFDVGSETQHRVQITRSFVLGATEVTQGQWEAVATAEEWENPRPSSFDGCGDDCPVETVNRWEVLRFLNSWSRGAGLEQCYRDFRGCDLVDPGSGHACESVVFLGLDCLEYRLPTEAEWEYSARADTDTPWSCGADAACLAAVAWYAPNSSERTHRVGSKDGNGWGLHDVHGNVWEWTGDRYGTWFGHEGERALLAAQPVVDPIGASVGQWALRGGGWGVARAPARSAYRGRNDPEYSYFSVGFRAARTLP